MNYLDKLLTDIEIEWKPLDTEVKTVTAPSKLKTDAYRGTGKLPIIDQGAEFIAGYTDQDIPPVKDGEYIIFGDHSEHIKYVDFPFIQGADGLKILSPISANTKYIYYAFCNFHKKESNYKRHWSTAKATLIPIPFPDNHKKSLEIQAEIVQILDAFTALTSELRIELSTRKKQYNHYRDKLLSFNNKNVEWRALADIGEFIRGKRFTKADYAKDGISVIHYGEIYTKYGVWATHALSKVRFDLKDSLRYAKPGDVIIASVGETVEDVGKAVAWIGSEDVAIHDDSYAFRHSMNPKYISYAMQTALFIDEKAKHVSRGKINRLLIDGMEKIRIPIPFPEDIERSLAEQTRIVGILDKFNTLINSPNEGIPLEIELRKKQYEYYRGLLLSFTPQEEVAN